MLSDVLNKGVADIDLTMIDLVDLEPPQCLQIPPFSEILVVTPSYMNHET
jgi:hypothetical protein